MSSKPPERIRVELTPEMMEEIPAMSERRLDTFSDMADEAYREAQDKGLTDFVVVAFVDDSPLEEPSIEPCRIAYIDQLRRWARRDEEEGRWGQESEDCVKIADALAGDFVPLGYYPVVFATASGPEDLLPRRMPLRVAN